MTQADIYDVTIIGGGPAGLFSTFYSGLREMKTKIVEASPQLGGKLNVYTEKIIWDIGALPPSPAGKVIEHLVEQAKVFNPTILTNTKIISIDRGTQDLFILTAENGDKHFTKAIMLATGYGILNPRKLAIEGAEKYEVSNLSYTIQGLEKMRDKIVVISGGGDSAIDWANLLEPIAKQVHLIYRQGELKGHESEVTRLNNNSVMLHLDSEIIELTANEDGDKITKVIIKQKDTLVEQTILVDEVVINHGFESEHELFENSSVGLEKIETHYVAANSYGETQVKGIYAAGDIVSYDGKVHLIAGAFHDAVNAVNQIKMYIEPSAFNRARVSSHNDKFSDKNQELVKIFFA
ncbi:NAD(P)/FAD-dependent oxidoreductase [Vagococcus intermedius]|uniref:Ferredoxin--NADP reductase n=1 Tax=Vagococcus intermedius TaxID=2991418 RepID=A0AAF0I8B2_9ENTE|nr:NAD(P)/FAD-dependent oxidoreductase [Vagococcus intermedius]WEG74220.1 NAD(P)/FAD-dependent oxidoreductase [Vagococcus intermedius]WEG76302.1 NAD(P)/FAD-dependent oxidoreductase [Vagococcus intermedius]